MSNAIVMLTALTGPSTFVSKASKPGMPIVLGNKNNPTNKPAAKYVNFVIHEHPFFEYFSIIAHVHILFKICEFLL